MIRTVDSFFSIKLVTRVLATSVAIVIVAAVLSTTAFVQQSRELPKPELTVEDAAASGVVPDKTSLDGRGRVTIAGWCARS